MTTVLLTRNDAQNAALMAQMQALDVEIVSRPLLRSESLPLDHTGKSRVLALDEFDDIFFISKNAVRFGLDYLENYWPQWPTHLRWLAVGRATAEALQSAGVDVVYPSTASSEDLLALPELQQVEGRSCLIVRGLGGRETLKQGLQDRGAKVSYLEVYQRLEVAYAADQFPTGDGVVSLIYSGEALTHLYQTVGDKALSYHVILPSQRLQTMALEMGFNEVELANSQEDNAMLEILNKILGQQP